MGAGTPYAASADIVDSDGQPLPDGVDFPANQLVELEPGKVHMVLRDVRQLIRGGDFMEFTMGFENAGSITFNIQSRIPVHDEGPSPTRCALPDRCHVRRPQDRVEVEAPAGEAEDE